MTTCRAALALIAVVLATGGAACGGDEPRGPVTLTLVTYDSFPAEGTSLNTALAEFTADTGITVRIVVADLPQPSVAVSVIV